MNSIAHRIYFIVLASIAILGCKKNSKDITVEPIAEVTSTILDTTNTTWASYSHGDNQTPLYDSFYPKNNVNQL
jgi:hypothetical protein